MVAALGRTYATGQDVRHRTFWGRAAPGRHGARPLARWSAHSPMAYSSRTRRDCRPRGQRWTEEKQRSDG